MLGILERKLAAIVADAVATRPHLSVATTSAAPGAAGRGDVTVTLASIAADPGFSPADLRFEGSAEAPRSRRVLPLAFTAAIRFTLRPAADTPTARDDARALILEDVSAVAHRLSGEDMRHGAGFAVAAPDPGFDVARFTFAAGTLAPDLLDGRFVASLAYDGSASVWPVGAVSDEGVIAAVDPLIAPLPLSFEVTPAAVRAGETASVAVALGRLRRTDTGDAALAVVILADVPIAARGTVPVGNAGSETGVRIVPGGEHIAIPYQAPAGDPGPNGRTEYLAVHLATPDGRKGVFLGSAAIRLLPVP